jgi:hypothetical protein
MTEKIDHRHASSTGTSQNPFLVTAGPSISHPSFRNFLRLFANSTRTVPVEVDGYGCGWFIDAARANSSMLSPLR